MKVLHLDTGREWRGGQQQVLYLTQGLEELGVVSVVATPQGSPLAKKLRDRDLPCIEIPYSAPYAPKTVRAMQRILADRTWNVLHSHTAHAHTLGFLAHRLPPPRSFLKPAFVISRRVDFVPSHDPLSRLKYTAASQYFVCVSEAVRNILEEYGVPAHSLFVVRSGVRVRERLAGPALENRRRELRQELGVPEDAFLLSCIGQFVPHKGHTFLLDAMAEIRRGHPDVHLVLLGDGELESELKKKAKELDLDGALTFAGYRSKASRFLPAFDLFVHPSIEEGLGTSVLDAEAMGIPVVTTRTGGLPEAVRDGVTGILVEPANPAELTQAILGLIADPARQESMGEAGRRWISETFSEQRMVEETYSTYRDILGKF